jgi:serine/threonine protein kinase/Tfp pilus assembly protein PilF
MSAPSTSTPHPHTGSHRSSDPLELAGRLAEELGRRWRAGERPLAEELLGVHPWLLDNPEATLELVAEELYLRQESGEPVDAAEVVERFPRWRKQVGALVDCHRLLAPELAAPRFPAAGETLGSFRLLTEMGRGLYGVVFLATQPELSERSVVLKIGAGDGDEHLSLARLQHTHIVPLYSVHDFPARGLRALCLPYFGGATLAELLRDIAPVRRSGRDLLAALRKANERSPVPLPVEGPACEFLARSTYVRAVCWLGSRLADALAYAAERDLVHLDLKPSNVLIAADGQPMLLDFHLARAPLPAGSPAPPWLGGTPAYMAPEQRAALAAVREGRQVPIAVDGRADVYALGIVLYETLGGTVPLTDSANPVADLRRHNPQVSPGLAGILAKCIAADPARRYQSAAALANDLRRHLDDLPLRGVANRSVAERWQKWRRRRPLALPVVALLMTAVAAGAVTIQRAGRQAERALAVLQAGTDHLQSRQYAEASELFRHGRMLAEGLPFCGDLLEHLREGARQAERGLAADELHVWCERIRPLYGAEPLPKLQAQAVSSHCQTIWNNRLLIVQRLAGQSAPDLEKQVQTDLLDLAILLADLRLRLAAAGEIERARQESLAILDEAERLFGTSRVLTEERRARVVSDKAGIGEQTPISDARSEPRNAHEHVALGRIYFRCGEIRAAEREMDLALEKEPGALWPNFWKGNCAFRLARFDDAVVAFSVCVALAPQSACCYANRGLALTELGRLDRAAADFDRALRLDPALAMAVRGRGLLHYKAHRYPQALADLRHTLELGADPAAAYCDLALVYLAAGNRAESLACVRRSLEHNPTRAQAQELIRQLGDARSLAP